MYLVVHGKPASLCCQRRLNLSCRRHGRLQDNSISSRVKRRTQAIAVKLADRAHDARAEVTGTTRH